MTLKDRIVRHIVMNGPLPIAEYMHWCMSDPDQGYYTSGSVLGRDGDFITAPEISQMFGELIGVWLVTAWESAGKPSPFVLAEFGPGRGTLMRDILRAVSSNGGFREAARIVLVETSPSLKAAQRELLSSEAGVEWVTDIADLPSLPLFAVANEFLDVLPFRQFVKQDGKWLERCVGVDEKNALCWVLDPASVLHAGLPSGAEREPDGAVFEVSAPRDAFVARLSEHLATHNGAALLIDYGHLESGFGDTFQAMAAHAYADPLASPGKADLTSHVDFAALQQVARESGAIPMTPLTQGEFLLGMGLLQRAGRLGSGQDEAVQARLTREAERLAHPGQMGDLFKVLAIAGTNLPIEPFGDTA